MLVVAGDIPGLEAFEKAVAPVQQRFPMRLGNHAAFHTPLQEPVAAEGRAQLPMALFRQPDVPMIDGRGKIWNPGATDCDDLFAYTLGEQVIRSEEHTSELQTLMRNSY